MKSRITLQIESYVNEKYKGDMYENDIKRDDPSWKVVIEERTNTTDDGKWSATEGGD